MNANVNKTNRVRLNGIRKELFDMANSYAGDEHGHIACRLHGISNSVYNIRDIMEVLYPLESTPPNPQHGREPKKECKDCVFYHKLVPGNCVSVSACKHQQRVLNKAKPLAQYLDEYIEHEIEVEDILSLDDVEGSSKYNSFRELLEQALDAYQSTENVTIKIERV